jgi:hypothetical protein
MNKKVTLTLFAMMAAVVALPVHAATNVKVDVPFAFVAGPNTLPAGQYRIAIGEAQHVIRIEGAEQSVVVLAQSADAGKVQPETKLVFERFGDQTFLSKVWVSGRQDGEEILKSRSEVNLERMSRKAGSPAMSTGGSQD